MTVTNKKLIPEEIKSTINSGNPCSHTVENNSSFRMLYKNVNIKIHGTIVLPVVLYGCETLSLILREEDT
jgi:hypothetical protein